MSFLFVPELGASTSESDWPSHRPAPSVTWRGKPMPLRSWRRAWRRAIWTRLLSGTTYSPLTLDRGITWWTASLRASRVSLGALRDGGRARRTIAGYGRESPRSSPICDRRESSWRTSQGSFMEELNTFSGPWPISGSMRNGEISARERPERPIYDDESSSWPSAEATPNAHDGHRPTDVVSTQGANLQREAQLWQTPSDPAFSKRRQARQTERGEELLPAQAVSFPTPRFGPHGTPGAGLRHPTIESAGPKSSTSSRVLNPLFVEWLMGFPIGWTDSGPLGMVSFPRWRRAHGLNSATDSRAEMLAGARGVSPAPAGQSPGCVRPPAGWLWREV